MTVGELTTHVLDLVRGCPAQDVEIVVSRLLDDGGHERLAHARTNADGRTDAPLLADAAPGRYELLFDVGGYFARQQAGGAEPRFLGLVPVRCELMPGRARHHVPLLCTPWSYSTYLGS